ncbi:hypothetical protein CGRA01v4_03365 [Colletotrichum graminicola]|nr:hypothetical protein CGRA01v4_03365 [Colletotrichum graminicola]
MTGGRFARRVLVTPVTGRVGWLVRLQGGQGTPLDRLCFSHYRPILNSRLSLPTGGK